MMNKKTHVLLARRYMEGRLSKAELKALCIGAYLPDVGVMCFFRAHTYARHKDRVVRLGEGVLSGGSGCWYWLKVGYLSHYIADFFTEPHNRVKFTQFCSHHRDYEAALHAYFLAHLWKVTMIELRGNYNLSVRLPALHTLYMSDLGTVEVDFDYIVKEVCMFFEACIRGS